MNAKALLLLAVLTGAAVYGALQVRSNEAAGEAAGAGGPLLPALESRLNDVTRVVIEGGDEPVTLERTDRGWGVVEKAGFPADFDRLSDFMAELRQARRVERKTRTEAGFAKLGVLDPDAEDSDSRKVTLFADDGTELGAVVVGNARTAKGFSQNPVRSDREVFVRVAGDEHAWLAAGNLTFDTSAMRWLDTELANIPRDRVQAARFESPGAEPLTLVKPGPDAFELEPLEVPEGREPKKPLGTSVVLNALAGLRFDDVQRAEDFGWPTLGDPSQVDATLWTDDGLRVSVTTIERDGKTWGRLAAAVVDPDEAPSSPEAEAEPEVAGPPTPESGDGPTEDAATSEDDGPSVDEVAAEAAALNATFEGWVFSIPSWKAGALRKSLEDVLAPLPEPEEDGGDAPPAGESGAGDAAPVDPPAEEDPPVTEEPVTEEPAVQDPPVSDPGATPPPVTGDPPAGAPPTGNGGGV